MEGNLLTGDEQWTKLKLVVDTAREVWRRRSYFHSPPPVVGEGFDCSDDFLRTHRRIFFALFTNHEGE